MPDSPASSPRRRVALVTGASRGIGADIARRLANDGYAVACGATSQANAQPIVDELVDSGALALAVQVKVQDEASVVAALDTIEQGLGTVSALVSNAGIAGVATIDKMSVAQFDEVIDVNLRGVFICTHHVVARMIAAGLTGSVISIGSIAGIDAFPARSGYVASKAAVHQLTKSWALDLASHGIRVNCVAPGYVRTDLVQTLIDEGRLDEGLLRARIPMGDFGEGTDVAAAVSWLVSDESRYVTGETLVVDGGWVANGHV